MPVINNYVSFVNHCKYVLNNKNELEKMIYSSSDEVCLGNIDGSKIEVIKERAFKNIDFIKMIYLPCELKTIEKSAFEKCKNLVSVFYQNELSSGDEELLIQSNSFLDCTKLDNVYIKTNKRVIIEGDAFKNCVNLRVLVIESPAIILSGNFAKESPEFDFRFTMQGSSLIETKLREWKMDFHKIS